MLRERNRIGRQEGFSSTLRKGSRRGDRSLVVSVFVPESDSAAEDGVAKAGVIVGKRQIPRATQRNRVKRRLRHLLQARIEGLPGGTRIVVRALEGSFGLSSAELGTHLDRLLAGALKNAASKQAREAKPLAQVASRVSVGVPTLDSPGGAK